MWSRFGATSALAALALGAANPPAADPTLAVIGSVDVAPASIASVAARCDDMVQLARSQQQALEAATYRSTIASTLVPYDRLYALMDQANNEFSLISQSNPSKPIRDAAQSCVQRVADLQTAVQLSRPIYQRLAAIPLTGLDDETTHVLQRQLLEYRLAGVSRDAATRARIAAIQQRITATGLIFDANIRDAPYEVTLKPAQLAGLPADFIAAYPARPDGTVRIVGESDTYTLMQFAEDETARKAAYIARTTQAWPKNGPVLRELLSERAELARLIGYPNYAAVNLADKMIGTPERATAFLNEANAAATPGANRDYAAMLARWRRIDPTATKVDIWNGRYISRLLRNEQYDVDDAKVRSYFSYEKARIGIFRLAHDLFGADIRPWRTRTWDPTVTAWEVYDGNKLIGRFYLDPYPREGKYGRSSDAPIRIGVEGRSIPLASLELNFPASGAMDHDDVSIFLHEFGHLLHSLYSGHHRWALTSMNNIETDFIEAPSQLLEEWVWDYDTLATFASDANGRTIPRDLVARMNRARSFNEGVNAKTQMFLSAMSLDFYTAPPATMDFDRLMQADWQHYNAYPYEPESHIWASFDHLNNYTASYYTYVWSKAIALDLFTRFQAAGLHDRTTAMEYRRRVLEPGSSVPAEQLVSGFLHRPLRLEAYRARIAGGS